jgi:hypothetical protein
VLLHLINETARRCGYADDARELVERPTGSEQADVAVPRARGRATLSSSATTVG